MAEVVGSGGPHRDKIESDDDAIDTKRFSSDTDVSDLGETEPSDIDYDSLDEKELEQDEETEPSDVEELDVMTISGYTREGMTYHQIFTCDTTALVQTMKDKSVMPRTFISPIKFNAWKKIKN